MRRMTFFHERRFSRPFNSSAALPIGMRAVWCGEFEVPINFAASWL
jgi:hypothetical protein